MTGEDKTQEINFSMLRIFLCDFVYVICFTLFDLLIGYGIYFVQGIVLNQAPFEKLYDSALIIIFVRYASFQIFWQILLLMIVLQLLRLFQARYLRGILTIFAALLSFVIAVSVLDTGVVTVWDYMSITEQGIGAGLAIVMSSALAFIIFDLIGYRRD